MHCSSCGAALPAGARFCAQCGTSQGGGDEERRVVTVLFADIVGFTGLSETLDPEEVKHQVDRTFERLALDITSFGGVVDKVLGDGIVALFGAPVAHEDDAERAVRAGLAMQQTLMKMGAGGDLPIRMRIGVNTGEVLVGTSAAGGDYTAMGDVMNSAARLESMAEPGQVLVGSATHDATSDAISYRFVGELPAKGRVEAIRAHSALSPIRPPGGRTRLATPFVGRDNEMALIRAQARVAMELGRSQATLIVGEAGMGKTRIAHEAANMIAAEWDARIFEGRSVPYGEANVWWPIAEIVRQAFNLSLDATQEEAEVIFRGLLPQVLNSEIDMGTGRKATGSRALVDDFSVEQSEDVDRFVTALLHALGYPTKLRGGDRMRNRTEVMLASTTLLGPVLKNRPAVIVLSDMHWATEAVWALMLHVLQELYRAPLMVIMTARKGEMPSVGEPRYGSLVLQLGALAADSSRQLLNQLETNLPDDLLEDLLERAGGNPFFLEELASLVSARVAEGVGDEPNSAIIEELRSGSLDSLPGTLRGLISARLDGLVTDERAVLDAASVLGRSGSVTGLERMLSVAAGIESISEQLANLVEADLLSVEGSRYSFRSHLVRDVAYGTLTKTARAQIHHGIASYLLEARDGGPLRNSAVVAIATHLHSTAELVNDLSEVEGIDRVEANAAAIHWSEEAGSRASEAGVPSDAEGWYSAALGLASDDQTRARLLLGRAHARSEQRDIIGTRSDLDRLDPLVVNDQVLSARALMVRGDINRKAGDHTRAVNQLREANERFEGLGRPADRSLALRILGLAEHGRGNDAMAAKALESARVVAAEAGDRRNEAWAIQTLGTLAFRTGDVQAAGRFAEQAADLFRELDDRGGLTFTRGLEAWVAFHSDDWDTARNLIDQILPETQRRGDPWAEGVMLQLHASLQLWNGESAAALETARLALSAAERADDITLQVSCRGLEGRSLVSRGRIAEATAALETATALAESRGTNQARRSAAVINAASAARIGEGARALRAAARYDHAHDNASLVGETDLIVSLCLGLLQQGKLDEAVSQMAWLNSDDLVGSYVHAARAILAATTGDDAAVEQAVDAVFARKSTYLDRVFALGARAAVQHRNADFAGRDATMAAAKRIVDGTDDVLTPRFFFLFHALCLGHGVTEAQDQLRAAGVDPSGWETVWALASTPAVQANS